MGLIKSINAPVSLRPFSVTDIETQARGLVLQAKQAADQIIAAARTEAANLRKKAYEEGLAAGRKDGYPKGLEEGKKTGQQQSLNEQRPHLTNLAKNLTGALAGIDAERRAFEDSIMDEIIPLTLAITRRVTKRQSLVDPGVLEANLREVMKFVVHSKDLIITINPDQAKLMHCLLPQLQVTWPELEHARVIEDPRLSTGSCKVTLPEGEIDADIDRQLERVISEIIPDPNAQCIYSGQNPVGVVVPAAVSAATDASASADVATKPETPK